MNLREYYEETVIQLTNYNENFTYGSFYLI